MTAANGSQSPRYRVVLIGLAKEEFLALVRRARPSGRSAMIVEALRSAEKELESRPIEAGDPLYRLRHMKMLICRAVFPPLFSEYGVHEDRPVVIIRHVAGLADAID